ncbi:hypothetical protein MJL81_28850, partial [Salmonella enterica subsp. enterica serovar Anatum]|nr:hypothetical protein [Salmonella enterica subsp. enterica serovar Anatum]
LKKDRFETLNQIGKQPEIEKQLYGKFLKMKQDIDNDSLMKARKDSGLVSCKGHTYRVLSH